MFETFKNEKPKNNRLSLVMGALLSVLPTQSKALELPPHTDWYQGAALFIESAQVDKNEFAGMYVENAEGLGIWTNIIEGDEDGVNFDTKEFEEYLKNGVQKFCIVHTHPEGFLATQGMSVVPGPSFQDLEMLKNIQPEIKAEEKLIGVMFTPIGLWYYEQSNNLDDRLPQDYPSDLLLKEQVDEIEKYALDWLTSRQGSLKEFEDFFRAIDDPNVLESEEYQNQEDKMQYLLSQLAKSVRYSYTSDSRINDDSKLMKFLINNATTPDLEEMLRNHKELERIYSNERERFHSDQYFISERNRSAIHQDFTEYLDAVNGLYALQGIRVEFVPTADIPNRPACDGPN